MPLKGRGLRLCFLALALLVAPASAAASAPSPPGGCDGHSYSQPFAPWGDNAWYTLAPGGDFEAKNTDWSGSGGTVVAENEPWKVGGARDKRSLRLGPNASVTSTPMCVAIDYATFRFFAKGSASSLAVDAIFTTTAGLKLEVSAGSVQANGAWSPTAPMLVWANGFSGSVAFRFTPVGGTWLIDDVYVDPYRR